MTIIRMVWMMFLTAPLAVCAVQETGLLTVTLPEEVVVQESQVCLSSVCALEGATSIVQRVGSIQVGSFLTKGQVLRMDRHTILSRLAASGMKASQVQFRGFAVVTIRRNETQLEPAKLIEAARSYLDQQLAEAKPSRVSVVKTPAQVILNDPNSPVDIVCAMGRYQTAGSRRIAVSVRQKDVVIAETEIVFSLSYKCKRAIALKPIEPGDAITTENTVIQDVDSSAPADANWREPYGQIARRTINQGVQIHPDWLVAKQAEIRVRRNQPVLVVVERGALFVSAGGQAMDDGKVGDLIRVRRGEKPDEKIIYCTVQPDGSVRPQI